jgi:fructokinase
LRYIKRHSELGFPLVINLDDESTMIATIGEALVDLIEQPDGRFKACLGGSVCNFTVGLARQGLATTYLNPLSVDRFGQKFRSLLLENGVSLGRAIVSMCPTSLAVVSLDKEGTPSYVFHREGVADRDINAETLVAGFPEDMALMHTGGLALVPEDIEMIIAAMQAATNRNALVSIDTNMRPQATMHPREYIDAVLRAIRQAHIVKVSDEDLDILGFSGVGLPELANAVFYESAVQLIAVTRGPHSAALLTRACLVEIPVPTNLQVVDTVGAGDCFHSGLIAYLQRSERLDAASNDETFNQSLLHGALRHAISAASLNIMRSGCDPATWEETRQFDQQW